MYLTSRIDYVYSLFANALKIWTDKLQRVMNAAARVISGTRKFDRGLMPFLRDDLHWLDVPQRIKFKLCLLVEVFTWLCTTVSCRTVCTSRRRLGAPQSALCHSRSTKFPSVQHDKLWPTSILVRRPSCLELTARTSATNYFSRPFLDLLAL